MQILRSTTFLVVAASCALQAANPPRSFVMNTTEPLIVSKTVLPPGGHIWKLVDSQSNRDIVQITDEATNRVEAVIFAVPNYREVITSDNEIGYWETPVGYAKSVRSWFLPGESFGQEFPYSKKVVLSTGRLIPRLIPAKVQMEPVSSSPQRVARSLPTSAQAERQSAEWPEGSWAIVTDSPASFSPMQPIPKKPKPHDGIWDTLKRLPLTATIGPLIGLIGVGFVLAFFLSSKRKNRQMSVPR